MTMSSATPEQHSQFWSQVAAKYDPGRRSADRPATDAFQVRDRVARERGAGSARRIRVRQRATTTGVSRTESRQCACDRHFRLGCSRLAKQRTEGRKRRVSAARLPGHDVCGRRPSIPAFMSLLIFILRIHRRRLREMHRILKAGGHFIIANLEVAAGDGHRAPFANVRCVFLVHGATGYRLKPPKNFAPGLLRPPAVDRFFWSRPVSRFLSAENDQGCFEEFEHPPSHM